MEIRPLRQFKSQELRSLFDQEREEWERQLYWDYREPQRVISAMIDTGTLPGFVAMRNGMSGGVYLLCRSGTQGTSRGMFRIDDGMEGRELKSGCWKSRWRP